MTIGTTGSQKITLRGSLRGRMPPEGASLSQSQPACAHVVPAQGPYGDYGTDWWFMVRRRSTVRFRKGAPGRTKDSNTPTSLGGQRGGQAAEVVARSRLTGLHPAGKSTSNPSHMLILPP